MGGFVLTVSALCGFVCAITVGGFFRLLLLSEGAAGRMPVNLFALMSVCSKHGGAAFHIRASRPVELVAIFVGLAISRECV